MEIRGRCWGGGAVEELDTTWPPLLRRWGNFRFLCSPSPGAHSSPAPCCRIDQDDLEGLIGPRDEIPAGGEQDGEGAVLLLLLYRWWKVIVCL